MIRVERTTPEGVANGRYLLQAIDLGRGSALLIDAGVKVLVDAGASDDARNTPNYTESHLVRYLALALGEPSSPRCAEDGTQAPASPGTRAVLDHVVVTKIDTLHSSQLDEVLECFEVKNLWLPRLSREADGSSTRFLRRVRSHPELKIHAPEVPSAAILRGAGVDPDAALAWETVTNTQLKFGSELSVRVSYHGSDSCYLFELGALNVLTVGAESLSCSADMKPLLSAASKPLWVQAVADDGIEDWLKFATWLVPMPNGNPNSDRVAQGSPRLAPASSPEQGPRLLKLDASGLGCDARPVGPIGVEAAGCDNWGLRVESALVEAPHELPSSSLYAYRGPARFESRQLFLESAFPGVGAVRRDFLPRLPEQLTLQLADGAAPSPAELESSVELRPVREPRLRKQLEALSGIGLHGCEVREGADYRSCFYFRWLLETPERYLPDRLNGHLGDEKVLRLLTRCSIAVDDNGTPRGEPDESCRLAAIVTDQDVYEVVSAIAGEGGGTGASGSVLGGMSFAQGSVRVVDDDQYREILRKASRLFYKELGAPPFNAGPLTGSALADDEFEARSSDRLSAILGAPAIEHATYGLRILRDGARIKLRVHLELMVKSNRSAEFYIDASPEQLRAYLDRLEKVNLSLLEKLCRELGGKLTEGSCKR